MLDKTLGNLIKKEIGRRKGTINLIASENFVSKEILNLIKKEVEKICKKFPAMK